jgi:hypothetical protein
MTYAARIGCWLILSLAASACGAEDSPPLYQGDADLLLGASPAAAPAPASGPMDGYLLIAPMRQRLTYLIDGSGRTVHRWKSDYFPGSGTRLLDDGSILRCCRDPRWAKLTSGGQGGRIQLISWEGEIVWDHTIGGAGYLQHHDAVPMPNGNVLLIAWETKSRDEAIARGRAPELLPTAEFWPDCILEVRPDGLSGGQIVWEWHAWDHVIQDFDPGREFHGDVVAHPERIDINGDSQTTATSAEEAEARAAQMAALGYIGGDEGETQEAAAEDPGAEVRNADWLHTNSIDYHAGLDLIVLSVLRFNEAWVIDHSTTTAEAAGSNGGRHSHGGDLLYRWGNPRAQRAGDVRDQQLFAQHHVQWIPDGLPGGGDFLCFNNGEGRPDGNYSSIEAWRMPISADGRISPGPARSAWRYVAARKEDFYAPLLSGVQRLPNGSTLITEGTTGRLIEVASDGRVVWEWRRTEDDGADEDETGWTRTPPRAQFRAFKFAPGHPALRKLKP